MSVKEKCAKMFSRTMKEIGGEDAFELHEVLHIRHLAHEKE